MGMSTLVAIVRTKSAATTAEASDARIIETLEETSVAVIGTPVLWRRYPGGTYTREGQLAIGKYRLELAAAVGSVDGLVLHDSAGVALTALTHDQGGIVTVTGVAALPTAYGTGRVYDVHAAAALIVEDLLSAARGAYDFKRGDQSFARSQMVGNLERQLRRLRSKAIPRRRGEMVMRDQAPQRWAR